jgi:hypothetical protein
MSLRVDPIGPRASLWDRLVLWYRDPKVEDVIPAGTLFRYEDRDGQPVEVKAITNLRTRKQEIEFPDGARIVNVSWGTSEPQPKISPVFSEDGMPFVGKVLKD